MAVDPLQFIEKLWPSVRLYDKQAEIIYSVVNDDQTLVRAGNQLGKDFIAALIALYFFLTRTPARVVTTSVDQGQLEKVLWGEINNFINTAAYKLPLVVNHLDIKKIVGGKVCPLSYIIGRVAKTEEGLLGHHLPRGNGREPATLCIYDEASGVEHGFKEKTDTWAHRTLIIGNPFPCTNFFYLDSKLGNVARPNEAGGFYKRVLRIAAVDSPSVKLALLQRSRGLPITNTQVLPGVIDYPEYLKRLATWDKIRQMISLEAEFYEGAEVLLCPPSWLDAAEEFARHLPEKRKAESIGIDPAEGGDNTTMSAIDKMGLIDLRAKKTPNTTDVPREALLFMEEHGVKAENVWMDIGGGGKQHADRLREWGYNVNTVAFGESVTPEKKHGITPLAQVKKQDERRYTFKNRRAEMYFLLRELIDPSREQRFGLPYEIVNRKRLDGGASLREQLAPIPLTFDGEGRIYLLSKSKKDKDSKEKTLTELIGCSPDEADSVALAAYGLFRGRRRVTAGAF